MPEIQWTVGTQLSKWQACLKLEASLTDSTKKKEQAAQSTQYGSSKSNAKISPANGEKATNKHPLAAPWPVDTTLKRPEIFRSLLRDKPPGRLLDLGAGHGRFSQRAQQLGWQVTAVDARDARFPNTEGIDWVRSDIRDFKFEGGDYDCICVLGLLYHLTLEDQLQLLSRCAGIFTIIDTHVALSKEVSHQGYEGKFYREAQEEIPEEQLESANQSSWGNRVSFWPTEHSLIDMIRKSGFSTVAPVRPNYREDRTFYVCYP